VSVKGTVPGVYFLLCCSIIDAILTCHVNNLSFHVLSADFRIP
jgi:hypothetical protein